MYKNVFGADRVQEFRFQIDYHDVNNDIVFGRGFNVLYSTAETSTRAVIFASGPAGRHLSELIREISDEVKKHFGGAVMILEFCYVTTSDPHDSTVSAWRDRLRGLDIVPRD